MHVKISPEEQEPGIPREWLAYSPETLIRLYGTPSSLKFFVHRNRYANSGSVSSYTLVMYFDTVDLISQYIDSDFESASIFRACPLKDKFLGVHLWLGKDPEYPPRGGFTLEEASSKTMEEFVVLMTGDPENACIDLNSEIFP